MKIFIAIALLALACLVSGCGGADGTATSDAPASSPAPERDTTVLEAPPDPKREAATAAWVRAAAANEPDSRWRQLEKEAGPLAGQLIFPHGPPPREVVVRDLKVGDGRPLEPGDGIGVDFSSYDYRTGERTQVYSAGRRLLYQYGTRQTVKAWDPGLEGMREGGVRELIAPSKWAYGSEALVYLIKLNAVEG